VRSVSGKKFCRVLEKHGWTLLRVQGSHHIYGRADNPARLSIPVHGNQDLKLGLLRHMLRVAGLSEIDL
jgi:predicted RNA binding protein YcfA (HicA-like mRNA interferase family)